MNSNQNKNELPQGFAMALAQNSKAMANFSSLTEEKKQSVIAEAKNVSSKPEMRSVVDRLGKNQI